MMSDDKNLSVFGNSLLSKKLEEIKNNPLYLNSKATYRKKNEKSSLAGEMPAGDFSGRGFLDSDLYKIITRDVS